MEIIIRPNRSVGLLNLGELWRYRELFYVFSWRDIKIRYKQTLLGVLWVLFQPLATTGIFSIFFGKIAKIPSDNIPYPLFVFAGLTIWNFFSTALATSSQSLLSNEGIIKKVYFPRLIIPISAIITAGVDFAITMVVLILAVFYYGYHPNWQILFLSPILLLILLMTVVGLGLFTSSLNVKYRDVRYVIPFFIQIGLFLTPVIYPLSVIYDYRKLLLGLNPLSGVIETFRVLIIGSNKFDINLIVTSLVVSLAIFVFGLIYFNKTESYFADIA